MRERLPRYVCFNIVSSLLFARLGCASIGAFFDRAWGAAYLAAVVSISQLEEIIASERLQKYHVCEAWQ